MLGAKWIAKQAPIDLATALLNDETVPPTKERLAKIQQLASKAKDISGKLEILEGIYLKSAGSYLALFDMEQEEALTVGTTVEAFRVAFPNAGAWRRLSYGIGKLILAKYL